jgi:putative transposase
VTVKRVRRLWNELGLKRPVRRKKPRKLGPKAGPSTPRCAARPSRFQNDGGTCDFLPDRTADGRPLTGRTWVDEDPRTLLVRPAAGSRTGADVRTVVARVVGRRGAPGRIRSAPGSEFVGEAVPGWLKGTGSEPIPVAAGRPWEHGEIESCHSRRRDEFLERTEFASVADAWGQGS